ncbi:MAG: PepSY domain-containing protein [Pseudolabrys sp.]
MSDISSANKPSSFKIAAGVFGAATLIKLSVFALAVMMLGLTSAAQAGGFGRACTAAPQSQWLPIEQLRAKVEAQGFTVKKAKLKKACGELYALDKKGQRVELFVDPTSGKIVGQL